MPSADEEVEATEGTEDDATDSAVDEARSALLESLMSDLGDGIIASRLDAGQDLWIRITNLSWTETGDYLRNGQRFRFFDWLSAIDWMQSPFGRSLEAAVDVAAEAEAEISNADEVVADEPEADDAYTGTGADGVTGGSTRFQVFARVHNLSTGLGLNIKADVPESELSIGTWTGTYPGAAWHEREVHEMFGITFTGNKDMRNIYLPTDFEGHPLRKDFPLLARLVKPWPGIIDVEPMPVVENPEAAPDQGDAEVSGND